MPKVSIIIPNYNHAAFLEQRIDSIRKQTFRDYELIILDDGSTDGSLNIIRRHRELEPAVRISVNERNSGNPFKQWDRGVELARGDYVWIAESDDLASPEFLAEMTPVLDRHRDVGLVHCRTVYVDDSGARIERPPETDERRQGDYFNTGRDEVEQYLCQYNTIPNVSGILFRRSSYAAAAPADADMQYCGDWFLYIRLLMQANIAYRAKPLNFFRFHEGSSRKRYYADQRYLHELLRVYAFVVGELSLSLRAQKGMRTQLARHVCLSLGNGFVPDRQNRRELRLVAPHWRLDCLGFLLKQIPRRLASAIRS
jgi:glycosyltransferase involved in cell wall biosynthesis